MMSGEGGAATIVRRSLQQGKGGSHADSPRSQCQHRKYEPMDLSAYQEGLMAGMIGGAVTRDEAGHDR